MEEKDKNIGETAPFSSYMFFCSNSKLVKPSLMPLNIRVKNSRLALLLNWYEYYDIKIIWHTTLWHRELSVSTHGFSHSTHRNAIDGLQGRNFSPRNSGRWGFSHWKLGQTDHLVLWKRFHLEGVVFFMKEWQLQRNKRGWVLNTTVRCDMCQRFWTMFSRF